VLFDPAGHEPLTDRPWSEARVRTAIAAIVADAEGAFDADTLWPAHPRDEERGPLPSITSLYLGASGVVWALDELERHGAADLRRSWAATAVGLHERYLAAPDFAEDTGGAVPSLWMGEAGILLVGHRLAPARWQDERLLACVRANVANPTRELMWGSPGTMLAADAMHERSGAEHWAQAWRESAHWLWDEWRDPVWRQDLYGREVHYLGPAHGFAGNVHVLARGGIGERQRRRQEAPAALVSVAVAGLLKQSPGGLELFAVGLG